MSRDSVRTIWMLLFAVLLVPTGYGMITGNFALAGACLVMLIIVRVVGIRKERLDEDAGAGSDED